MDPVLNGVKYLQLPLTSWLSTIAHRTAYSVWKLVDIEPAAVSNVNVLRPFTAIRLPTETDLPTIDAISGFRMGGFHPPSNYSVASLGWSTG